MDTFSKGKRSEVMRRVKSENTKPEMLVRRLVYSMGYRYRLHDASVPGKPDLVFKGRRKAIFVHGCFWHGHGCARGARTPKTNRGYWEKKIGRTVARDQANQEKLRAVGWTFLLVWECQLTDREELAQRLQAFLDS